MIDDAGRRCALLFLSMKPVQTIPGYGRGTKSREGMRDFVEAENFCAALRFGLDCSPLRSVPSRPKPSGETEKFSACLLSAYGPLLSNNTATASRAKRLAGP